jgi:hypothetical protein
MWRKLRHIQAQALTTSKRRKLTLTLELVKQLDLRKDEQASIFKVWERIFIQPSGSQLGWAKEEYAFGPSVVGWLKFGRIGGDQGEYGLVFCAFVKGRGVSAQQLESCGHGSTDVGAFTDQKLLFRYKVSNGQIPHPSHRDTIPIGDFVSWVADFVSPLTRAFF